MRQAAALLQLGLSLASVLAAEVPHPGSAEVRMDPTGCINAATQIPRRRAAARYVSAKSVHEISGRHDRHRRDVAIGWIARTRHRSGDLHRTAPTGRELPVAHLDLRRFRSWFRLR